MVQLVEITGVLNEKGCIEIPICPSNNLSSKSHHCIKVIMVTIFLMLKLIITLISSVNYYNIKYYQNSFSLS